jgi:hypothetical protein
VRARVRAQEELRAPPLRRGVLPRGGGPFRSAPVHAYLREEAPVRAPHVRGAVPRWLLPPLREQRLGGAALRLREELHPPARPLRHPPPGVRLPLRCGAGVWPRGDPPVPHQLALPPLPGPGRQGLRGGPRDFEERALWVEGSKVYSAVWAAEGVRAAQVREDVPRTPLQRSRSERGSQH